MQALTYNNGVSLETTLPQPTPQKGEALVRITLAGICATDLEIIKGYMDFKGVLGHEFTGVVEGPPRSKFLGKRVVGEINIGCGNCTLCKNGEKNHCPRRKVLGILNRDGAFAEFLTLPEANLHLIPVNLTDEEAVFTEPLASALEISKQIQIKKTDTICVLGDGRLGLLTAMALSFTGASICAIGRHPEKLALLKDYDIETQTNPERLNKFDITVDATGSSSGVGLALRLTKPRGTVVIKTTAHDRDEIDLNALVINEQTLVGSRCGPFDKAIEMLSSKKIDVNPLITKTFALSDGLSAIEFAASKGTLKVLIDTSR
ncbi:MAG: alcohol dehydrogenase catalytic domain-containing protein [Deltaproteobacteria bacterium]|nr:alcohol dehydrogenase catalytic domain-containing protein [Deltaproteobacteria bacterium]